MPLKAASPQNAAVLRASPEAICGLVEGIRRSTRCGANQRRPYSPLHHGTAKPGKVHSLGHAFYEAIRTLYPAESKPYLHGEIVAIGLLVQELYLDQYSTIDILQKFMAEAQMPTTLQAIGVPIRADISTLTQQAPMPRFYFSQEKDFEKVEIILRSLLT